MDKGTFMTSYFSRIFGKSPMRPLQRHMSVVRDCVAELDNFFQAVLAGDWERAATVHRQIDALEQEADRLKKEMRMDLPGKGLFLAVSRGDLLETLRMQDKLANRAKDIAGLVLGRRIRFPEAIGALFLQYVRRCIEAAEQAHQTVNELDELVETGFRGHEAQVVESMIDRLDEIESDTDRLQREIRSALFALEKDLPPVDVLFLYRLIEWTGDLGDRAQRIGSRLQLMLAR